MPRVCASTPTGAPCPLSSWPVLFLWDSGAGGCHAPPARPASSFSVPERRPLTGLRPGAKPPTRWWLCSGRGANLTRANGPPRPHPGRGYGWRQIARDEKACQGFPSAQAPLTNLFPRADSASNGQRHNMPLRRKPKGKEDSPLPSPQGGKHGYRWG